MLSDSSRVLKPQSLADTLPVTPEGSNTLEDTGEHEETALSSAHTTLRATSVKRPSQSSLQERTGIGLDFDYDSHISATGTDSALRNECLLAQPATLDLFALEETWDLIRSAKIQSLNVGSDTETTSMTSYTKSSTTKDSFFGYRGIRLPCKGRWTDDIDFQWLKEMAAEYEAKEGNKISSRTLLQESETAEERASIMQSIDELSTYFPTIEAEWRTCFWEKYFFKEIRPSNSGAGLRRFVENRQQHVIYLNSEKSKEVKESRYPQMEDRSRISIVTAEEPLHEKIDSNGYAYTDISYATKIPKAISDHKNAKRIVILPGLRLYRTYSFFVERVLVEVKPREVEGYRADALRDQTIRYLSLCAATIIYEHLQLCYIGSGDDFEDPSNLFVHMISAIGYTATVLICCIRQPKHYKPDTTKAIRYQSHMVCDYDLRDGQERNDFRKKLNEIHTLQSTIDYQCQVNQVQKVLSLQDSEFESRMQRIRGIQFETEMKLAGPAHIRKFRAVVKNTEGGADSTFTGTTLYPSTPSACRPHSVCMERINPQDINGAAIEEVSSTDITSNKTTANPPFSTPTTTAASTILEPDECRRPKTRDGNQRKQPPKAKATAYPKEKGSGDKERAKGKKNRENDGKGEVGIAHSAGESGARGESEMKGGSGFGVLGEEAGLLRTLGPMHIPIKRALVGERRGHMIIIGKSKDGKAYFHAMVPGDGGHCAQKSIKHHEMEQNEEIEQDREMIRQAKEWEILRPQDDKLSVAQMLKWFTSKKTR